jgi:hypothetical protein
MQYIKLNEDGSATYPLSIAALRSSYPNTSFPKKMPEAGLPDFGVHPATEQAAPDYDLRTQKIERQAPELQDGSWVVGWSVVSKSQSEIEEYDNRIASKARFKRNDLLAETDYFALTDVTMNAEMTSYRQALRDITTHANWPHLDEADWPIKPE